MPYSGNFWHKRCTREYHITCVFDIIYKIENREPDNQV